MDVAEVVRTARRHAGWTQQELARAAGTSQAAISDIERGQSGVSVERLDRILSAMGYRLEAAGPPARTARLHSELAASRRGLTHPAKRY